MCEDLVFNLMCDVHKICMICHFLDPQVLLLLFDALQVYVFCLTLKSVPAWMYGRLLQGTVYTTIHGISFVA